MIPTFRRIIPAGILVSLCICLYAFQPVQEDDNLQNCLEKYRSEWSRYCSQCSDYSKSYRAYFRNVCRDTLDVKVAAQETDKRWRSFTRLALPPGDSLVAYACKGTGKYLYWVRKPGAAQFVFPDDEAINQQYPK